MPRLTSAMRIKTERSDPKGKTERTERPCCSRLVLLVLVVLPVATVSRQASATASGHRHCAALAFKRAGGYEAV